MMIPILRVVTWKISDGAEKNVKSRTTSYTFGDMDEIKESLEGFKQALEDQ